MADKFRFGNGPAPETIDYLNGRGLATSFDWRDIYGAEHAYNFTVAKATQIDVLTSIHGAVEDAVKRGLPFAQFKKELSPLLKSMGWWGKKEMTDPATGETKIVQLGSARRLKTIYWANTRTAYGAGKWARAQRTKAALPYFLYQLGPSERHRPHHVEKENTILPIDHPFWNEWFPPNGWGCKCWVRQITQTEAEQLGGVSSDPDIPSNPWVNDRTGEVLNIPEGIDPGWQTNPGKARHRTLAQHLAGTLDKAPEAVRNAAMHDLVHSLAFKRLKEGFFKSHKVFLPVTVVPQEIADQMSAKTRIAFLSTEDAAKQVRKRQNVRAIDYIKAQLLLENGAVFRQGERDFIAQGFLNGMAWRAVFRVTHKGDEIFLKSLRRSNPDQVKRLEQTGEKLN